MDDTRTCPAVERRKRRKSVGNETGGGLWETAGVDARRAHRLYVQHSSVLVVYCTGVYSVPAPPGTYYSSTICTRPGVRRGPWTETNKQTSLDYSSLSPRYGTVRRANGRRSCVFLSCAAVSTVHCTVSFCQCFVSLLSTTYVSRYRTWYCTATCKLLPASCLVSSKRKRPRHSLVSSVEIIVPADVN